MVDSLPVPLQALLWPLAGALLILALRRLLPNWLRRVVALAAVLASLSALWSLRTGPAEPVTIFWEPLNFFRTSPALLPVNLALFAAITMAGITAALLPGIRGRRPQGTWWHGLILIALAGSLLAALAGNLVTLTLGSGLLDLALVALAIPAGDRAGRVVWRMVVPGAVSTLLLLFAAIQMDAGTGTTSLTARDFPLEILLLVVVAGLLRLLVFPLYARGLDRSEDAATLLLPMGTGIYLLARAQAIGPVLVDRPWVVAIGAAALLAGGLMAWAGSVRSVGMAGTWSGIAVHQAGLAVAYVLLLRSSAPWPWVGLALALGLLAVWWDLTEAKDISAQPGWFERLTAWLAPLHERLEAAVQARTLFARRWRESWAGRHALAVPPVIALLSLAGVPFTAGVLARWPFYATLLQGGQSSLLIAAFVGDTLLAAGLWATIVRLLGTAATCRPRLGPLLSLFVVTILLVAFGIAPDRLAASLGIKPAETPGVSVWGLGLVFVLPWLLGAWLARVGTRLGHSLESVEQVVGLEWLYRAAAKVSQALAAAVYWLGVVGEGEGWWGWALIVLALGALFFTIR